MELQIKNKIITAPIKDILELVRSESNNGYLNYIGNIKGDDVAITCPWHKDGQEQHPSCHVYAKRDNPNIYYGTVHCFTCGKSVPLYSLVGKCFEQDDDFGKQWLIDRFGDTLVSEDDILDEIILDEKKTKKPENKITLDGLVDNFDYLNSRGISSQTQSRFSIKYDPNKQAVVFPVWDANGKLSLLTERYVNKKQFYVDKDSDKPVYLLNFVKKFNIDNVYVVESQINALTLWDWGYPAIALMGTGSKTQYEILKRSGISSFCLALDGDNAGRKGVRRFIDNMPNDRLISVVILPEFKDVNDLSRDEFLSLNCVDKFDFLKYF